MSCTSLCLIICATALFYCLQFSTAGDNGTDHLALLEIKAKITHDPLGVTSSWNDSLHFCKWQGVTCGHGLQRVVVLDLQSSKLTGFLSPYIGNLSFLRVLQLQNNSFIGKIPPEIGRLYRLQSFLLTNNSITGRIPSDISGCSSLVDLRAGNNRLVGEIPSQLGMLLHLQFLSLSDNNLTGAIPSTIGNLSLLSVLSLSSNHFVGRIPDSLGKLKKLTILALFENQLSRIVPPSIFNLSMMTKLHLGENDFEGTLPSDLGFTLPQLQFFAIDENRLSGTIPASLSNSSNLGVLQLSSNNLEGQVPSLQNLVQLTDLVIGDNFLGDSQDDDLNFVSSLANATMLEWLDIGPNNFKGIFPRVICNFSTLTFLKLESNKIAGQIPPCIENLAGLQVLNAWGNNLTGVIPSGIGMLQNLNEIDLSINQLTGDIPSSFGNLTRLTTLQLSVNNLEGHIPSALGYCTSLFGLDLSQNNLIGNIPLQIFSLPTLSIVLDLSKNQLTGPLPDEVGQLNSLEGLDVSENKLAGEIPSTFSACIALQLLYIDGNLFQGTIPDTLDSLKGLRELDMSRNNLSGKIPKFLVSLPLQMLNLSYNNLQGNVPTGGVFSNATGVSVIGNSWLCGGIPELKLLRCHVSVNTQKRRADNSRKLIIAVLSGCFGVILMVIFLALLYVFWYSKRIKEPTTSGDSENFPNLSYQSLFKATNGFSTQNMIGSGSFGVVYRGILDQDGTVAIKLFNLEHQGASKSFMAECEVLRNIRHRNLLKVITACSSVTYQGSDFKALVYEYMVNGSLDNWLHPEAIRKVGGTNNAPGNLNLRQRLDIAIDVAFALDYLHHHCGASVVHCDLKPSNILLDDEMVAHVGDFGLAKFLSEDIISSHLYQSSSIGVRGTIGYTPPEYGLGSEVSTYGDVYSYGILLLEMFTGKRPTDKMFEEGLSLHDVVKAVLPEQVMEILDPVLLEEIVKEESCSSVRIEAVITILEIALSCSGQLPRERLDIGDVVASLSAIRSKLPAETRLEH